MSSFDGIHFGVVPDDGFYPGISVDNDYEEHYRPNVLFLSSSDLNAMRARLSFVTTRRPLGSTRHSTHIDAGAGAKTLSFPSHGGTLISRTAVLVGYDDIKGYAKEAVDQYLASLDFLLIPE